MTKYRILAYSSSYSFIISLHGKYVEYIFANVWIASLNVKSSKYLHVTNNEISFFLAEQTSIIYLCHTLIHLSAHGMFWLL